MGKKYTQQEVEKLIAGIREAYETKLRQINYRLDGLVSENRGLRASIAQLKERESKVGKAIVDAETKGEEIKEFYRMSAQMELQTFRLFADKWRALAESMIGQIPDEEAKKYASFASNLAALLGEEDEAFLTRLSQNRPQQEQKRTQKEQEEFDPKAIIEKYVEGEEETGFNLDDVLNPKGELDLEKLCRGLGLMEDKE